MNPTDRILKVDVVGRVWKPGEQREAVLDEFPLVPRVSAALWERMRGAKLRFCGRRVSMVGSFRGRRARMGDGVSPGSTFPKRCANFGNERQTRGNGGTGVSFRIENFPSRSVSGIHSSVWFCLTARVDGCREAWIA
jgi:hypothetical protein